MIRRTCIFLLLAIFTVSLLTVGPVFASREENIDRVSVSGGWEYVLLVTPDGRLLSLGGNEFGQLGNGENGDFDFDTNDAYSVKANCIMTGVKSAAAVNYQSMAIKNDGTLWTWGFNHLGVLGKGNQVNASIPAKVLDNVESIASGQALHTLAIKKDNTLWAWGGNNFGQLGDGTTKDKYKPIKVMDHVRYASVGYEYSAIIKEDNSLWMWGNNCWGNLGDGTRKARLKPVKIMENVLSVSTSQQECFAIKTDGTLWRWGSTGPNLLSLKPKKFMDNVKLVSASSDNHNLAIKKDGSLWIWGVNSSGQLGNGTLKTNEKPVKVMDGVKTACATFNSTYVIKLDNTVWAWGGNKCGQLGTGDTKIRMKPVKVMDLDTIADIGKCIMAARSMDGNLSDWNNRSPLAQDNEAETASSEVDLTAGYAEADSNYLYLAAGSKGINHTVAFKLDTSGDGKVDYIIQYDGQEGMTFSFIVDSKNNIARGPDIAGFYIGDVLEMRVPLKTIGNPKGISVHFSSWKKNGDNTFSNDDIDGWYDVQMK